MSQGIEKIIFHGTDGGFFALGINRQTLKPYDDNFRSVYNDGFKSDEWFTGDFNRANRYGQIVFGMLNSEEKFENKSNDKYWNDYTNKIPLSNEDINLIMIPGSSYELNKQNSKKRKFGKNDKGLMKYVGCFKEYFPNATVIIYDSMNPPFIGSN